jgi:hypothetical protein
VNGGGEDDSRARWQYREKSVIVLPASAAFYCWRDWARFGQYPEQGGWLDQPLSLLVHIEAIEMTVQTFRYLQREDADWSTLTAEQVALIRWLEAA